MPCVWREGRKEAGREGRGRGSGEGQGRGGGEGEHGKERWRGRMRGHRRGGGMEWGGERRSVGRRRRLVEGEGEVKRKGEEGDATELHGRRMRGKEEERGIGGETGNEEDAE